MNKIQKIRLMFGVSLALSFFFSLVSQAVPGPEPKNIHISDIRKTSVYIREGLFLGGDQIMSQVSVTGLRYSTQAIHERIVVDLSGTHKGELAAIARPPYYQVHVDPLHKRVMLTVFGSSIALQFNEKPFLSHMKKSTVFESAQVFPLMENDRWNVAFQLKKSYPIEVFELKNPTRIVIDIKKE